MIRGGWREAPSGSVDSTPSGAEGGEGSGALAAAASPTPASLTTYVATYVEVMPGLAVDPDEVVAVIGGSSANVQECWLVLRGTGWGNARRVPRAFSEVARLLDDARFESRQS